MCSCAALNTSSHLFCLFFKVYSCEFGRFTTLTWPCSGEAVYCGEFVGTSTSGKWGGKMS